MGPLHGLPVTIKENIDQANLPNPNGVPAFADLVATEDAPLVRNLRTAGAIVIGRTNTPEFSMRGTTDNPLQGRTRNPWGEPISPARGPAEVKDIFDSAIYSTGINYLGLPAGVIGMDLVEDRPAAVQLVGRRYREDMICAAMGAIEARNGVLVHRLWEQQGV